MKTIEITIDPQGQTRVETRGFTSSDCRAASQFLEQSLGSRTAETLTAEFHQGQQAGEDVRLAH